jgi:hypothetical protein
MVHVVWCWAVVTMLQPLVPQTSSRLAFREFKQCCQGGGVCWEDLGSTALQNPEVLPRIGTAVACCRLQG